MKKKYACFSLRKKIAVAAAAFFLLINSMNAQILRVGVAGLNHDHAYGLMSQYKNGEVAIIGIAEPDEQLALRYKRTYHLPDSIFYKTVPDMLAHIKPDAVLAYNAIADHLAVVE